MPVHLTQQPYVGHCMAGELIPNVKARRTFQVWKNLAVSEVPRFYLDATLRFSSEQNPLSGRAILQQMAFDPFYERALGEDTLTARNFITNWYRIKNDGLWPLFGPQTDDIAVSENRSGRETVYFLRGESIPKHSECPISDDV